MIFIAGIESGYEFGNVEDEHKHFELATVDVSSYVSVPDGENDKQSYIFVTGNVTSTDKDFFFFLTTAIYI